MADIFIAIDEQDTELGFFINGCKEDFVEYFNTKNHNVNYIHSRILNPAYLEHSLTRVEPFIFVAYSHGENHRLISSQGEYISTTCNNTLFNNSFFYTVSCLTANELGENLISNNCKSYYGYKSLFNIYSGFNQFSHCANLGLILFLEGISTVEVLKQMKDNYNEKIDELYNNHFFQASLLRENRDGLIYLGEDITIVDLI